MGKHSGRAAMVGKVEKGSDYYTLKLLPRLSPFLVETTAGWEASPWKLTGSLGCLKEESEAR